MTPDQRLYQHRRIIAAAARVALREMLERSEVRWCACGCGRRVRAGIYQIGAKKRFQVRYICGHWNRGRKKSSAQIRLWRAVQKKRFEDPRELEKCRIRARKRSRSLTWQTNHTNAVRAVVRDPVRLAARSAKQRRTKRKHALAGLIKIPNVVYKGHHYDGYWFRSSWELAFAKWLRRNKIRYAFEPFKFILKSSTYIPDFYLPDSGLFIEIKGHLGKPNFLRRARELVNKYGVEICILMGPHLRDLGVLTRRQWNG